MNNDTSDNPTIQIPLTKGYVAIVDAIDADLAEMKWIINATGKYAQRSRRTPNTTIRLHCIVMERVLGRKIEKGEYVDHINNQGLDNRRSNLRICSSRQNSQNRSKSKVNTSGFKGVHFNKRDSEWHVRIMVNGKRIWLGSFVSLKEAAKVYNDAALKYFGEFAWLNPIPGDE